MLDAFLLSGMGDRFKDKQERRRKELGDEQSRTFRLVRKSDYQQEVEMEEDWPSTIS
ncbi:hypothetical protein [Nitrosospira sp. Nsp1]|uniref:hypothetical protein n=1 Tax=Nitrosospira sp. Nsp1 TaxID=136547 RepID=UPI0015A04BA8|nr:hypothetical protein [Nitrosospira sp. Nsp1]